MLNKKTCLVETNRRCFTALDALLVTFNTCPLSVVEKSASRYFSKIRVNQAGEVAES